MRDLLIKEARLSTPVVTYVFVLFALMFLLPGYPVLCGVFFVCLGLYKGFDFAREANDTVFTALLPVAKKDVVNSRVAFVALLEGAALLLMTAAVLLRATVLRDAAAYRSNPLMNANLFALGAAFLLFGLFNRVFVGGFFKTGYKTGRPFLIFTLVCFTILGLAEALHHLPGLGALNAFGADALPLQLGLLAAGILSWALLTVRTAQRARAAFEKIDL